MMTLTMQDVAKELADSPVRFVSISVDPNHDTPAELQKYATDKEMDLSRWTLMTGEFSTIEGIARGALGVLVGPDRDPKTTVPLADGTTMQNILHPSKLILVGPDRRVLGFYEYSDPEAMRDLVARAKEAARAGGGG